MPTGYQIPDPLPWATIAGPLAAAEDALARLDERLAKSPIRAGFIARTHFTDARASLWLEGALVHLDDLVLHDAGMDIRAPTHELTRAHAVLRTRGRIADGKPDWALPAAGLARLRGRGGRGESDENTAYLNEDGDEAVSIDDGDDEADSAEPCEVPPTDDRLADVFAAVDAAIAQANRMLVSNSTSPGRDPLIYDPDWHEDARLDAWRARGRPLRSLSQFARGPRKSPSRKVLRNTVGAGGGRPLPRPGARGEIPRAYSATPRADSAVAIRTSTARRFGTQRFRPAIRLRYGGRGSDSIELMQELRSLELFASDRSRGVAKLHRASDNTAGALQIGFPMMSPAPALPPAKLCAKNQLLIVRKTRSQTIQALLTARRQAVDLVRRAIISMWPAAWMYFETVKVMGKFPASVLTTVNAPYSKKLDAPTLAHCLTHPEAAKAWPGQMSAFFGEVAPELQKAFAGAFHISEAELVTAAKTFARFSGESYPLAA